MMAIFHDMVEDSVEVFMDDFSVFGKTSFDVCLGNLEKVLARCEDTNLVFNWEKYHFLVREGIVLRHKVCKSVLEVDKTKVGVIEKLPPSMSMKGVHTFLDHVGFSGDSSRTFTKLQDPYAIF